MSTPLRTALVEDEAAFRAALASAVMQADGFELVGTAADLPDGLQLMRRVEPQLLLVDLQLPSGSGLHLIEAAAAELPGTEVVVVTTLGDEDTVLAALAAGAVGYLLKQGQAYRLVEQLQSLREGGAPLSPVLARQLLRRLTPVPPSAPPAPLQPVGADVSLTAREIQILEAVARGYRYEEIAGQLAVSLNTVSTHVKRCYRKLQAHSKTQALAQARRLGLIS
ncbi:response regulator [Roseateles sp. BYS78W]|uniref:Response regulator n=1 Tax=Pelomonas candidula TaxID=3299025 RepID=A0ABW7HK37_9BURK